MSFTFFSVKKKCMKSYFWKLNIIIILFNVFNFSYNGVLVWKIKDLKSRMAEAKTQDGLELVSAPFYTSQYGYKVQASLFLNGNGGGDNSHLSVYIKLLPGDYDSILKWPFR